MVMLSRKTKKCLVAFGAVIALTLALWAVGIACPEWFLYVEQPVTRGADAMVVLGGEPWTRPQHAAEVYQEVTGSAGATMPVIVSGDGDCQDVRRQLEDRRVPASVIETECESRSTWENALFSVKLLRAHKATNVVLVTSWYHSRRALACFRTVAPEITFISQPTAKPPANSWWPEKYERRRIFQEYAKIIYYRIFHGVSSW